MREFLREFFSYSKSEQKGLIVLLILIVSMAILRWYAMDLGNPPEIDKKRLAYLISEIKKAELKNKESKFAKVNIPTSNINNSFLKKDSLFYFNPNTLDETSWQKLGLSEKQAKVMVKYSSKGNAFKTKEDLKKVFVVSEKFYSKIEKYIVLNSSNNVVENTRLNEFNESFSKPEVNNNKLISFRSKEIENLELNSSDTTSLKALKGIGRYLSFKIIRYKNKLGGFIKKEQLLEIEGIDTALFSSISDKILVDSSLIEKIKINKASTFMLSSHPYFSKNLALALVNYRDKHGKYTNSKDLKKCLLVNDKVFQKIVPYLSFE